MENYERKFNVNPEGEAEEEQLSEEEKMKRFKKAQPKGKKIFTGKTEERQFVVDEKGEVKIEDKDKKES